MLQDQQLTQQLKVRNGTVLLIDGGGATIKWRLQKDNFAFEANSGAKLCLINMVLDGQGTGHGLHANGAGTLLRLENVMVKNCRTWKVHRAFACCPYHTEFIVAVYRLGPPCG